MSIIVSHATARSIYRLVDRPLQRHKTPVAMRTLLDAAPTKSDLEKLRHFLTYEGLPEEEQGTIDALVLRQKNLRHIEGLRQHCATASIGNRHFIRLDSGVFIVDICLCALQAATDLSFRELVEYYYELCGSYTILYGTKSEYRERNPLTTAEELSRFFKHSKGVKGAAKARRAIAYVRNGCRSPLETAFVMTLVLPKSEGGLGIRNFQTDHHVAITLRARDLTRRESVFFDAYLPRSKTDIEYNGFMHDTFEQQTIDEERKNALQAMGYRVITVNRHSFFDPASFKRVMTAICRAEGIRPSSFPTGFPVLQEQLRRFVLRRYYV